MRHRVAFIDVGKEEVRVEEIEKEDIVGPIDWGLYCHLELYKSYQYPPYDEHNVLCFGMGKLAGGVIPGTHRLIGVFRSPLWGGIYFSTVGGAAYPLRYVGFEFGVVEGRAKEPTIVILKGLKDKGLEYRFEHIGMNELMKVYREYKGWEGVFALYRYLLDKYRDVYKKNSGFMNFRMLVVGPAAVNTNMGGIFSATIRNGEIDVGSEGWMARGGGGSVLFRAHGVVAIIYGGDNDWRKFEKADLRSPDVVNDLFKKFLGVPMGQAAFKATEKYRFSPSVGTGGTFGVNYATLKEKSIMFNWKSVFLTKEERKELYDKLIKGHYLKQFNDEIIANKSFKTCGEPCPGVCKKVWEKYKKDYEVYTAAGTICGIFDQRAAERAVHAIDSMGFDAIEFGTLAGWILECLEKGLLKPEEVGARERPRLNPKEFKIEDSFINAEIVEILAKKVAFAEGDVPRILGEGMRRAARKLDEMFSERVKNLGISFRDLAVYVPLGNEGSIAPCQYWDPAFLVPLPMQGTFFTKYHAPFMEPEDFAKACYDRFLSEMMMSENMGICRFHRGWAEKVVEKILNAAYGTNINLKEHGKEVFKKVIEYDAKAGAVPVFWEGRRVLDIFWTFVKEEAAAGNERAKEWLERFKEDAEKAGKEYWERFLKALEEIAQVEWKR